MFVCNNAVFLILTKQKNMHTQAPTVLLYTYNDIVEANAIQVKLKEAGIDSFIEYENVVGFNPGGGVKVKIFSTDMEAAEKIISE
jgi:hypothetical protein